MIIEHYDVCILASSPSSYIAAEFLSKKGYKILLCEDNSGSGSKLSSYYPFYFSINGPLMESVKMLGMEKSFMDMIKPLSLQILLPSGRYELYQDTDRRMKEMRWLFGGTYEAEILRLERLKVLSDKVKKILSTPQEKNRKIKHRILSWFLKRKLSHESRLINSGQEHFFKFLNHLTFPLLNNQNFSLSPFYSSIMFGEAFTLEDYPGSFVNFMKRNISSDIDKIPLSEIQINKNISSIKIGKDNVTFKFILIDSTFAKNLFPKKNIFKKLKPVSFWFPVQLRLKKEGFPVGMGKYALLINPNKEPENANLLYIKSDLNAKEVVVNTYSIWGLEMIDNQRWVENVVGSVMDRIMELMPFVNKHLLHLIYPENFEDIQPYFFNYLYSVESGTGLFSPVIRIRPQGRVFITGPEIFPQWGIDADAMSAMFVVERITRSLRA